ncbi:indoleamine 2,3-dioxygenase protein [Rutstroemia sp. NJR-2017a WRK4]|nr:indoleamine 2,3-dioxygenase protein [Rutstroemia sp. NJR-2017a WRK4]
MLGPLNINLAEFGVSQKNGFLPDTNPLPRLDSHTEWEILVDEIPQLLESKRFRQSANAMPILDTSSLSEEPQWRRAYHLLSFMTHAYIWGGSQPSEILPAQIAKPFLTVSSHLGLPPTATYAGLNLWNFTSTSPTKDLTSLSHLSTVHTFTSTPDESWFYLVSVAIEARGAGIIPVMLDAMDAVRANEPSILVSCLRKFASCIQDCGEILKRMYEHCDPEVFYHIIRPFLAGSKNMAMAGLPRGVFYDEGDGKGEWRCYSGGSNAQSSLIQFWDAVLGVKHVPTRGMAGKGPANGEVKKEAGSSHGFLDEMRKYMPGPHRAFLNHISAVSPIHTYISHSACDPEVTQAYNDAVETLTSFRDIHIQIVTRYIINPSRKATGKENAGLNLAVATTKKGGKEFRGTGGTQLIPFLKQSRDETRDMLVPVEAVESAESTESGEGSESF